jgi:GNAT superfamily N-acetyltransferase
MNIFALFALVAQFTPKIVKLIDSMNKFQHDGFEITYAISPAVTNDDLNPLFAAAWEKHTFYDFLPVLKHGLAYVCAYDSERLVGYVNLAWDGAQHAFILDTTVHPDYRRHGIGVQLVKEAVQVAREHKLDWVHVDYDPHLQEFYEKCGFKNTPAGLIRVS